MAIEYEIRDVDLINATATVTFKNPNVIVGERTELENDVTRTIQIIVNDVGEIDNDDLQKKIARQASLALSRFNAAVRELTIKENAAKATSALSALIGVIGIVDETPQNLNGIPQNQPHVDKSLYGPNSEANREALRLAIERGDIPPPATPIRKSESRLPVEGPATIRDEEDKIEDKTR